MSDSVDVLVRAADAGDTYLSWRWLDDVRRPLFEVLRADVAAPALAALDAALVSPRPGERGDRAARRALTEGAFADVARERELARSLAEAVLPERLRDQIRQRSAAGLRIRMRLTPSPRLARVPWELLTVDGDVRLLELADVVLEPPAAVHADRAVLPAESWDAVRDRPPLLVIDPQLPTSAGELRQVLDDVDTYPFDERIDAYLSAGRLSTPDGDNAIHSGMDRVELSAALRLPRSRFFYFGHVTASAAEPGSAAIHLNDTAAEWGLAAPVRGHRPFAALDMMLGTGPATDPAIWRRYGFGEARTGPELWPMPQRVAVIGCEGGADYRAAETFGLVVAMVNAGASLVTTTRWTLPADWTFRSARTDFDGGPTSALALRVDTAQEGADPLGTLTRWQRTELHRWRASGDIAHTPLVWAALTHSIAPARVRD
ncbi:hypothetical protein [Nocardia sp. BMG111209]|uniref:hypothetical protein n=1 Tax=Nocardia sp. BMG111209 TaxID=1160137 RepID=UPI00037C9CD4|nr:hypothetical protein [Nocardia sp. BMG111209]